MKETISSFRPPPDRLHVAIGLFIAFCALTGACSDKTSAHSPDAGDGNMADAPMDSACNYEPGAVTKVCGCNYTCVQGAQCGKTKDYHWNDLAVCTSIDAGICICGVVLDNRCANGARCFCPRAGDFPGICLTHEQRDELCSGPLAESFTCQPWHSDDAGLITVDDAGKLILVP